MVEDKVLLSIRHDPNILQGNENADEQIKEDDKKNNKSNLGIG